MGVENSLKFSIVLEGGFFGNCFELKLRCKRHEKTAVISIKILTFFIGRAVLIGIIDIPIDNPVTGRLLAEILPFAVVVCFTIIFLVLEKVEVRIPVIKNCGKGFLVDTILGVFLNWRISWIFTILTSLNCS